MCFDIVDGTTLRRRLAGAEALTLDQGDEGAKRVEIVDLETRSFQLLPRGQVIDPLDKCVLLVHSGNRLMLPAMLFKRRSPPHDLTVPRQHQWKAGH